MQTKTTNLLIMTPTDSLSTDARQLLFCSARSADGYRLQLLTAIDATTVSLRVVAFVNLIKHVTAGLA